MSSGAGEGGGGGGEGGEVRPEGMKKGPWTAAEDALLAEYVRRHGEGNWNAVQKYSGLMRCGKSCRLRWANHLRPNLKKGQFTLEEERLIIQLHAKLGNKWARMASQLPGRTDNEIKNYWNTKMKRRQRAGLPLYPHEASSFHLQNHHLPQNLHSHQQTTPQQNSPNHQPPNPNFTQSHAIYDPMSFPVSANPLQSQPNTPFYTDPNQIGPSSVFALPLSSVSGALLQSNPPTFPFNSGDFENDLSFSSAMMEASIHQSVYVNPSPEPELPSNQTPPQPTTPVSSGSSSGVCAMTAFSNTSYDCGFDPSMSGGKSGLLSDVLFQANSMGCHKKSDDDGEDHLPAAVSKRKQVVVYDSSDDEDVPPAEEEEESVERVCQLNAEKQWDDFSSQSSFGMKLSEDPCDDIDSMDEDLSILLSDFPSPAQLPDWYINSHNHSNGSLSGGSGDNAELQTQQNVSPELEVAAATTAAASPEWAFGTCLWNNMPSISEEISWRNMFICP